MHMFEHDDAPPPSMTDVLDNPDSVAAELAVISPGPDHDAALSMLDPAVLSDAGRIDLLIALERQIAWLTARQQRVLASLDGRALDWAGKETIDYTREQVGAALRLSPGHAADRLAVGRTLVDQLPATLGMLQRGEITYLHAKRLAEAVVAFDAKTTAKIEDRVLVRAADQSVGQFSASVRRAVIAADPRLAEQRHEDAVVQRCVVITPQPDGMAELCALLPAEGATLIKTVLDSLATTKTSGETRTLDQRRADALVDVFARVLSDPALPEQHGQRPTIQVTVAASTLLGCDDRPADLDGYGPITAHTARRIAADPTGTWHRILTDPTTRQILDYGRKTYRPPRALADHVITRDRTCVFPGCTRPARHCQLDHGQDWCTGGTTCEHNLHPLCTRHHHTKHNAGWTIQHRDDGSYLWTNPTGHQYTVHPPDGQSRTVGATARADQLRGLRRSRPASDGLRRHPGRLRRRGPRRRRRGAVRERGAVRLGQRVLHGGDRRGRQVRLDELGAGEAGQLALQVGHRHVTHQQGQPGTSGWHRGAQFRDRRVLDAGIDELGVERAATGRGRAGDQPADRAAEQRAEQQAPHPAAQGAPARRDVGGLGDVRRAIGVALDEYRVVHLQFLVLLQAHRGEQELLRAQAIVEGNDQQLLIGRLGHAHSVRGDTAGGHQAGHDTQPAWPTGQTSV